MKQCELCLQPMYRHNDRRARWKCTHCAQELCSRQVTNEKHDSPFCTGPCERIL